MLREASAVRQADEAKVCKRQIAKNEKRIAELDLLFRKTYEDFVAGRLTEKRFEQLSRGYETEQAALEEQTEEIRAELAQFDSDSFRADKFMELAQRYTDYSELSPAMLHEFVEKVIVHEADRSSGRREQRVDIYLNYIGQFEVPEDYTGEVVEASVLPQTPTDEQGWLKDADAPAAPPALMSVIQSIAEGDGQSDRYTRIPEKTAARVLGFLHENRISTLPVLRRKVYEMQNQLDDLRGSMKYIERRLTTLDEHIRQGDVYLKNRELYAEYQRLSPRKQPKFYEAHRAELMIFEATKRYLDAHLNGHELPLEAWKEERAKLTAERSEFSREYAVLKEQVLDVESVQWTAERIMREMKQPQKDKRGKARQRLQ